MKSLLYFIHNQAVVFNSIIKNIEKNNIGIVEVAKLVEELQDMYSSRYEQKMVPLAVKSILRKLEETNPGLTVKFTKEMLSFYKTCSDYVEQWTSRLRIFHCLRWTTLQSQIKWEDVLQTIEFLKEHCNQTDINDNELFDEIRRANLFCENNNKIQQWAEDNIEIDQRWCEIFSFFKTEQIPYDNLLFIIEVSMSLPGTNASVERVSSIINDFWRSEKSRLSLEVLSAVISTKENLRTYTCEQFINVLTENQFQSKQ